MAMDCCDASAHIECWTNARISDSAPKRCAKIKHYLNKDKITPRCIEQACTKLPVPSLSDKSTKRQKPDDKPLQKATSDIICRYCQKVLDLNCDEDRNHILSYCSKINDIVKPVDANTEDLTSHLLAARLAGATKLQKLEIVVGAVT